MTHINREFTRKPSESLSDNDPIDETEWLDWDRWHAEAEYQDLVDGLSNVEESSDGNAPETFKDSAWDENVARQLHRHGLEIEG